MKKFFLFLTFLILFLVQTTSGELLRIFGAVPNLLLTFTIIYCVNSSVLSSVLVGAIAGLLTDVSTNAALGINALLMTYTAVFTSFLSSKILYERKIIICITVFALSLLYEFASVAITNFFVNSLPVFYITIRYTLLSCAYNTIVAVPLVYLINKLKFEYVRGI